VLVTGAGSGIGRATAEKLAEGGAFVIAVDRDKEAADKTAATCGGVGYEADVANRSQMAGLAEAVISEHGAPDILVNNAGVGLTGRFLDTSLEDWDWILGINLMGVVHGCHYFGPAMVARRKGHVVNVASVMSYIMRAKEPAYVASKAGVLAFTRSLRVDWRTEGVGVSAICPGLTNTAIVRDGRVASENSDTVRAELQAAFEKGDTPDLVARAIIGAIRHDRLVVPVGREAKSGWYANGKIPARMLDWIGNSRFASI
jgi:NAD(P)-dependent dehydrogenase (short-subunit alcohol dehydrogenase family)